MDETLRAHFVDNMCLQGHVKGLYTFFFGGGGKYVITKLHYLQGCKG